MAVAVAVILLIAVALDLYLGLFTRRRLAVSAAVAATAATGLWLCLQRWPHSAVPIYTVMGGSMAWFGLLAWRAANRERNAGHRIIAVAMLAYPACILAAVLVWPVPSSRLELSFVVALPSGIVGVAILVASLVRFGRRLEAELVQRRAAEEAVHRLNAELEQRVSARTAELRQIVEGLESFTRNVSHDLRGPLAGVAGAARLAEQALTRGDAQRAQRLLAPVALQADRLSTLVQDLLLLSRATDAPLERTDQPLRPVVDAALEQLRREPESSAWLEQVRIDVGALPELPVDAGLLRQAFVNLIGNALRFASASQASLPRVSVAARPQDGTWAIEVSDNGPGLPPEGAGELFKPFVRLHGGALSRNGIGLSIVKRIVERHGGQVWAAPADGGGARFGFSLPKTSVPRA
jgi:signal transduction histidine kinase